MCIFTWMKVSLRSVRHKSSYVSAATTIAHRGLTAGDLLEQDLCPLAVGCPSICYRSTLICTISIATLHHESGSSLGRRLGFGVCLYNFSHPPPWPHSHPCPVQPLPCFPPTPCMGLPALAVSWWSAGAQEATLASLPVGIQCRPMDAALQLL